jgi:hypothetical protein
MSAPGFEFFTSDDAGAPALYGAAGRLIAVLDWLLVTKGGWAKPYTGTNLATYRSATGNRFYMRVDDTQATYSRLRGYRAMTGISAGSNLFPDTTLCPSASWGIVKSGVADSTPRRYWGVRTNRYLYLAVEVNDPTAVAASRAVLAFGDVPSLCETDSFNTVMVGADAGTDAYFPYSYLSNSIALSGFGSTANGAHMAASPSGAVNSPGTQMAGGCAPQGQIYAAADADYGRSGRLQISPITLYSNEAVNGGSGIGIARALLPNVGHVLGVIPRSGLADGEVVTFGGRTYKLLTGQQYEVGGGGGTACGAMAIETSDTDGAL